MINNLCTKSMLSSLMNASLKDKRDFAKQLQDNKHTRWEVPINTRGEMLFVEKF